MLNVSRFSFVLSLALLAAACDLQTSAQAKSAPRAADVPRGRIEHVGAEEFRRLAMEKRGTYLDVRTPGEIARGHIPDTSVIELGDARFTQKASLMQKDRPVFVYCASGSRSRAAAEMLASVGIAEVYELSGGLGAWARAGYPLERSSGGDVAADAMKPEALDGVLAKEKRVLVDYHTPWCAPCRAMAPVVDALAEEWKGKAKVLRVDIGESEALAARERIQVVPSFVLYVDGKERWRSSGEMAREVLEAELARP
jgi:rhodanese-related sulfurtransferase